MYNEINPTEESVIFKQLAAERERVAKFNRLLEIEQYLQYIQPQ